MKTTLTRIPIWLILLAFFCLGLYFLSFISPAQARVSSLSTSNTSLGGTPDIALVPFTNGLVAPVDIANAEDTRLFVVEQAGRIRIVQSNGTVLPTPFLDIANQVEDGGEQGLLGLTFDPNYGSNGFFYVNYTFCTTASCLDFGSTPNLFTRISRFTVTANPNIADPNSEVILLTIQQPYGNHNAGDLNFGPDGYLYFGLGDGGSAGDPENRAQNPMQLLGKMLRIDVDGGGQPPDCGSGPYTIPADNPFVGAAGTCNEIWQFGVRNPWRFSFDSLNGNMYIADVGQGNWEEVNFQPASSNGGENWGWRCYEGNTPFNTTDCGPIGNYDFPFFVYNHASGNCSVTGGFVYRGSQYPVFFGHYIFTDFCSGLTWTAINDGSWVVNPQGDLGGTFTSFGEGSDGEIYLASSDGTIYHVIETTVIQTPTPTATSTTPVGTATPTPKPTRTPPGPSPTPTSGLTVTPTFTPTSPPLNTGFLNPSANAPVTSRSGDNNGFQTTSANAHADGGGFAVDIDSGNNTTASCTNQGKDRHLYYNFNVSLPTGADINGIEVRLDARADNTGGSPLMCVELSWNGGATWTAVKTTPTLTTAEVTYLLGGSADTWGRLWQTGELSNANFRLRITNVASSTARDFSLDWVAVKVYYQP